MSALLLPLALLMLQSTPAPRIEAEVTSHDLGELYHGESTEHTFRFRNVGDADLVLEKIRTSCGCLASRLKIGEREVKNVQTTPPPLGAVAPGEWAEVTVRFLSYKLHGTERPLDLKKHVSVFHDAATQNPLVLEIRVLLVPGVVMDRGVIQFPAVIRGQTATASAVLSAERIERFHIERIDSPRKWLRATAEPVEEGRSYRIVAEVLPEAPVGQQLEKLSVHLDHPRLEMLEIPVRVRIKPSVQFLAAEDPAEERLDFGVIEGDGERTVELRIENTDADSPYVPREVVVSARPTSEPFRTELVEVEPGVCYVVRLTALSSLRARYFTGHLEIRSDSADLPVHRVPFRGWVKR